MGSASIHRVGSTERVQFTVAELLGRYDGERADGERAGHRAGRVDTVPAGWPSGTSVRRRLAAAAGTVVVAGTFAAGAVLSNQPTHGGVPLGAETAGAGHPVEVPRPTRARAAAPEPPRRVVTPLARVTPVRPEVRRPVRRTAPAAEPRQARRSRDIPDRRAVRAPAALAPAGSALSGLTPAIGPLDALGSVLGGLGR